MKLRFVCAAASASICLLLAGTADAHLRLTSQDARYGDTQKVGPCGVAGGTRTTDKVYIARPGIQVMLVWEEFVDHPGFFRIDFDLDGDDDFVNPVVPDCPDKNDEIACFDRTNTGPYMVNDILDEAAAVQNFMYTLPDMPCTNCTLQVIQVMTDKPPYEVTPTDNDIYYQCVDIILDPNGPDELTLVPGPDDAGVPATDAGNQGGADAGGGTNPPVEGGGCQVGGSGNGALAALLVLGLIGLARRRQ